jgi:hypothetical protein
VSVPQVPARLTQNSLPIRHIRVEMFRQCYQLLLRFEWCLCLISVRVMDVPKCVGPERVMLSGGMAVSSPDMTHVTV